MGPRLSSGLTKPERSPLHRAASPCGNHALPGAAEQRLLNPCRVKKGSSGTHSEVTVHTHTHTHTLYLKWKLFSLISPECHPVPKSQQEGLFRPLLADSSSVTALLPPARLECSQPRRAHFLRGAHPVAACVLNMDSYHST